MSRIVLVLLPRSGAVSCRLEHVSVSVSFLTAIEVTAISAAGNDGVLVYYHHCRDAVPWRAGEAHQLPAAAGIG